MTYIAIRVKLLNVDLCVIITNIATNTNEIKL